MKMFVTAAGIIGVVGLLFVIGKPKGGDAPLAAAGATSQSGTLVADETSFDFGSISMANGKVTKEFAVRNNGNTAVTIQKLYTSCMCTDATFVRGEKRIGPFGMAGHGFVPSLGEAVAPGEEVNISVTFDPAAHGPAGIGRIERGVYAEDPNGKQLFLFQIAATVTP